MIVQSNFEPAAAYTGSSGQKKTSANSSDFQGLMAQSACTSHTNRAFRQSSAAESRKNEILNQFPALTEERLEELVKNYNLETMDSDELFALAQELMEEGIIPQRPKEGGLNQIAVFPMALYEACLNGDTSALKGTVRQGFSGCFTVNQASGSLDYQYPKYGLKNLEYDLWMMQNGVERYQSYFTDEERQRQRQLVGSKIAFWELSKLLSAYRQEVGSAALGIRS